MLAVERRNTIKSVTDCVRTNIQIANFPFAQDGLKSGPHFATIPAKPG